MASSRRSQPSGSIAKVASLEMPLPDNTPAVSLKARKLKALFLQGRSQLHRFVKFRIVEADWFTWFILIVIVFNAIVLALQTTKYTSDRWGKALEITDHVCLAIYGAEFILKFYADPIQYWFSFFNLFDFLILFLSTLQTFVDSFTTKSTGFQIFRVFRIVRVVRVMRTVRFIKGLEVNVLMQYNALFPLLLLPP